MHIFHENIAEHRSEDSEEDRLCTFNSTSREFSTTECSIGLLMLFVQKWLRNRGAQYSAGSINVVEATWSSRRFLIVAIARPSVPSADREGGQDATGTTYQILPKKSDSRSLTRTPSDEHPRGDCPVVKKE